MATPTRPIKSTTSTHGCRRSTLSTREPATFHPKRASGFTIIEQARQGVETAHVDQVANLLGVSLKEMAAVLQVAERTLHRFRNEGRLDAQASERLLLLENLAAHGLLVFDGRADAFADWLRHPLRELKRQSPLQLLTTISGFGLADDVLTRIEYGIYS